MTALGFAIKTSRHAVVLGTQLDSGHIADAHDSAVRRFADDDLSELFRGRQAALRENRIGKFLCPWVPVRLPPSRLG